jgi:hypothetical protein
MGIWAAIKQRLGIGGVKLKLEVEPQVGKDAGQLQGRVNLMSKSDQRVETLNFRLLEKYTTGRGDNETTEEFELGKTSKTGPIEMKAGQTETLDFVLPFQLKESMHDKLKGKGGALGALGKASSFMAAAESQYEVWVDADVKGTSFGPNDFSSIQLV